MQRFDPHSILVRFEAAEPEPVRDLALAAVGGQIVHEFVTVPGLAHVRIAVPVAEAIATLTGFPGVIYAEPDYIVRLANTPNDPQFNRLWGLHNIGQIVNGDPGTPDADIDAPQAWDLFTGDPNVVIAVVDTGVNYLHPDIAANAWINPGEIAGNGQDDDGNGYIDDIRGWDFFHNDADPMDDHGHGTFCAGVIGAVGNNGVGISGVNWRCKIMALKFISANNEGTIEGAIAAIEYAVANGARVSNHSWIATYSQSLQDVVTSAAAAGHLLVAASGNFGTDNDINPFYPAAFEDDNVIAVGGIDNDDNMPSFSNYGAESVDLVAPAVNVYSCWTTGYDYGTGTSAAAPHVTGVAALLFGRNPTWTYRQARGCIFSYVRRLPGLVGRVATGGVLNAGQAMRRSPQTASP